MFQRTANLNNTLITNLAMTDSVLFTTSVIYTHSQKKIMIYPQVKAIIIT